MGWMGIYLLQDHVRRRAEFILNVFVMLLLPLGLFELVWDYFIVFVRL